MHLDAIIDLMFTTDVAQPSDLVGVPLAGISELEKGFQVKLPISYIEFLHRCGRSAGKLSDWTAIYFDDLQEIAEEFELQKQLCETPLKPAPHTFIFAQYNTQFDYFVCNGEVNPAVYRVTFADGSTTTHLCSESLTEYMSQLVHKAAENKESFEPFYVDECGEIRNENLALDVPPSQ